MPENWLASLLIGAIGSILASLIFLLWLSKCNQPKLVISNRISKTIEYENRPQYRIKVVNRRHRAIVNLNAQLKFVTPTEHLGRVTYESEVVPLVRPYRFSLAKYCKNDKSAWYAAQFLVGDPETFSYDLENSWESGEYLFFEILVTDSFSGTSKIFKKTYTSKDKDIKLGHFMPGNTFEIYNLF